MSDSRVVGVGVRDGVRPEWMIRWINFCEMFEYLIAYLDQIEFLSLFIWKINEEFSKIISNPILENK